MNPSFDELREKSQKILYFGLGFIQVDYTPTIRYNFYCETLPRTSEEEELHNHRYNFSSTILVGRLTQWIYQDLYASDARFSKELERYQMYEVSCKKGEPKWAGSVSLELSMKAEFSKGSKYWINKSTFHKVDSDFCITRIDRPNDDEKDEFALVATKTGQLTCPFSVQIPENELWDYVKPMWANL